MDELQLARPELAKIIGERLRDVRRARGLSQQALAEGLFSKGYVSSIEHGKIFPSVRALQALAARLGVDMTEFFDPALLAAQARVVAPAPDSEETPRARLALLEARALAAGGAPRALQRLRAIDPESLPPPEQIQFQIALAQANLSAGNPDAALTALEEALGLLSADSETAPDTDLSRQIHSLLGEVLLARGQPVLAAAHLAQVAQLLQEPPAADPVLRLRVLGNLAQAQAAAGDLSHARATYQEALGLAQELGSLDGRARMLMVQSRQAAEAHDWPRAARYGEQALWLGGVQQALRHGLRANLGFARLLGTAGEGAAARERVTAGVNLAQHLGEDTALALALAQQAELAVQDGDLAAAEQVLSAAQVAAERSKDRAALAQVQYVGGLLDEAQGAPDRADSAFAAALAAFTDLGDRATLGQAAFAYARALTARGQAAAAIPYFEQAYQARSGM